MGHKDQVRAATIGANIDFLIKRTGISLIGLASATNISVNHFRTIKNGQASITNRTALKIANFFQIDIEVLFSSDPIVLAKMDNVDSFLQNNKNNIQFFEGRKGETSTPYVVKQVRFETSFFTDGREIHEIKKFIKDNYGKDVTSKQLSQVMNRMVLGDQLVRELKPGSSKNYLYKQK